MNHIKIILLSLFLIGSLTACAHSVDLLKEGKTNLEIIPPKEMVKISYVHVYKKEEGFQVTGQVQRTGLGIMSGHLDIAILSPEGRVWGTKSAYVPSMNAIHYRGRRMSPVYFYANFPDDLPVSSKVFVAFHSEKIMNSLDCGKNQALLGK